MQLNAVFNEGLAGFVDSVLIPQAHWQMTFATFNTHKSPMTYCVVDWLFIQGIQTAKHPPPPFLCLYVFQTSFMCRCLQPEKVWND